MKYRFVFDPNRCVGCHACVVACAMENHQRQTLSWRKVRTFNTFRHPLLQTRHLSMSCNHCEDPICLRSCPARAYTRDKQTGAVIHHADRCMGCQYCTWACPFEGPRYAVEKGWVEKCDFCHDRLLEGKKPACVERCPMDALGVELVPEGHPVKPEEASIYGFPEQNLKPSIRFKKLRRTEAPDMHIQSARLAPFIKQVLEPPISRVQWQQEWPLLVFTLILSFLVAMMLAHSLKGVALPVVYFAFPGALAMVLSVAHLGNKKLAYRAILNLFKSPLSQEIFFSSTFMALGTMYLIIGKFLPFDGWLQASFMSLILLMGVMALYSMDRIYQVLRSIKPWNLHSAQTLLSAFYLFSVLASVGPLLYGLGSIRILLYLYRNSKNSFRESALSWFFSMARLILGFGFPFYMVFKSLPIGMDIVWGVMVAEVMDRIEFYQKLETESPDRVLWEQMIRVFKLK